jgi:monofunctional biosynthetic peptidoglycan transglycosylase
VQPARRKIPSRGKPGRGIAGRIVRGTLLLAAGFYAFCLLGLVYLRFLPPFTTGVQIERRVQAMIGRRDYHKRAIFVPLSRISRDLQHAVIAAEDGRFYQHHGFDWKEIQKVAEKDAETGRLGRGASTITQQLVKNLFLTTSRSIVRKGIEFTLTPPAELILGKQRILELYLNVIEWGPGVFGAEAAAETWYHVPAAKLNREQAARLAAIIPSPRRRKPARMNDLSARILERMHRTGW